VSGFDVASLWATWWPALIQCAKANASRILLTPAPARFAARKAHPAYSMWLIDPGAEGRDAADTSRSSALTRSLREIETLLQTRNYEQAEPV